MAVRDPSAGTRTVNCELDRNRFRVAYVMILVGLLTFVLGLNASNKKKRTTYKQVVPLGFGLVKFDTNCISFSARMTAGDFFNGLERTDTPQGKEFRRGSTVLSSFPAQVSVEVDAAVLKCSGSPEDMVIPGFATDFVESLRFEANWKRGGVSRPVETLKVQTSRPSWSEAGVNPWVFTLTISARDVPLTDRLIVWVISEDGKRVASFVAQL